MSYADLKAVGMTGGPSTNRIDPNLLFIVGHDGIGATEEEKIKWVCDLFPKLASKLMAEKDQRAGIEIPETSIAAFRPKHAAPVVYENLSAKFPDGCGEWSGRALLVVNAGRQRTKTLRIVNARRDAEGSKPLDIQIIGKKFETDLDRRESKAIENASLVQQTPMHRAWLAHEFSENGMKPEDIAPLVNVTSGQAVRNLLVLCDASEGVARAVDLGSDNGGITQTVAQEIIKGRDHAAQDAELAKRLGAAEGKGKRERSQALRGESLEVKPKAVKPAQLARVVEKLTAIDRTTMTDATRVDEWLAVIRWSLGDDAGFDALPDEFRSAVLAAEKKEPRKTKQVSAAEEPAEEPANDSEAMAA